MPNYPLTYVVVDRSDRVVTYLNLSPGEQLFHAYQRYRVSYPASPSFVECRFFQAVSDWYTDMFIDFFELDPNSELDELMDFLEKRFLDEEDLHHWSNF